MFNSEKFAMMKDGISILNFARGGLVDNRDIIEALASGKVSTYVTDFPSADLLGIKGVIPIPHLGASTVESEDNCAIMACQQVKDFLETGNIRNSVNFPNCEMSIKAGRKRLIIANRNIPTMISEITTLLAENSINIGDMLNKSKGDTAYNIIDVDGEIGEEVLEKLLMVEGIIFARVLG
jgi:D-3-phosphoglycerate dehydrogenase